MTELYWNQHAGWPLLATVQLLPLAGAALLLRLGESARAAFAAEEKLIAILKREGLLV